jgi:hypothetical protein
VRSRYGRGLGVVLVSAFLSGCIGTNVGFQYVPERTYYRTYEQFQPVTTRQVKHVHENRWGAHLLGIELSGPDIRELVDASLESNPNYYVGNLNLFTEIHGTFIFPAPLLYLPRTVVDFDVIEVTPWASPPAAAP